MRKDSWLTNIPSSQLWKLFSPSIIKSLSTGDGSITHPFIRSLLVNGNGPKRVRISDLYAATFAHLAADQPAEYFYKSALLQWQIFSRKGSRRSRVLFEFRTGQSKLDALVLSSSSHAFEIKTERDHFSRLANQMAEYQGRFPLTSVLTSEKQAVLAEQLLPGSVGIGYLTGRHTYRFVREASHDASRLKAPLILESLRRDEYLSVLKEFGFNDSGIPNTLIFREGMKFADKLNAEEVSVAATRRLSSRTTISSSSVLSKLPLSVRAGAVAAACSDVQIDALSENLNVHVRVRGRS